MYRRCEKVILLMGNVLMVMETLFLRICHLHPKSQMGLRKNGERNKK